ncbi:MAG TPA: 4-alpha-glucanotransferase [Chitinophagales bacterium]|nr:4-alpha-glucanotransferase [Chitinophagales bacterium]
MNKRASGVLLHPTSLPGNYGIGSLGAAARSFVDFLVSARQTYWQILPLGPTGYGDSPYQCFSSNAGNPYLIDLDTLVEEGFLSASDIPAWHDADMHKVDYGKSIDFKMAVLKTAFSKFNSESHPDYKSFTEKNASWLDDYNLFMALKEKFDKRPWYEWEDNYRLRDEATIEQAISELKEGIAFNSFIQYLFFKQWTAIKKYANDHKIQIIGDIPIYVAMDSSDTWCSPELFQFDENKTPVCVGGCPPDYFSETGQLWGNPIYDYAKMEEDGFAWWINRIKSSLELYDLIRVDHFRGFAGYWSIPYGAPTAVTGQWVDGPGKKLFQAIQDALGEIPIIAEDLGLITPDVIELRDHFGLPGMKILQFAFDSSEANDYIPHNYTKNCVVYTGTHDNDTALGWFNTAKEDDKRYMMLYLNSDGRDVCKDLIRAAWASVANTAIVPMQDLLRLGNSARMNLPGSTENVWLWRMGVNDLRNELAEELMGLTMLYARNRG